MRKMIAGGGIEFTLSDTGEWNCPIMPKLTKALNDSHEMFMIEYSPAAGDPLNFLLQQAAELLGIKQIQYAHFEQRQSASDVVC